MKIIIDSEDLSEIRAHLTAGFPVSSATDRLLTIVEDAEVIDESNPPPGSSLLPWRVTESGNLISAHSDRHDAASALGGNGGDLNDYVLSFSLNPV